MKRIALLLFLCASAFAQRQSTFWTIIGRGTVAPSTCSGNVIFIISTDGSYRYCNGSSFINPFSGLGGIGTLNTLTDATQTFAKTNDTNVTLTITSSSPTHTFALGWTGTLAAGRLNSNVVQGITNDTNVTGSISTQNLTLGWTGTLAAGRLNGNVVQGVTNDTNVTGGISAQNLTIGWTGTLAKARQNSATVYNDAANTWSTGLQDLGAATVKIPSGAGFTAGASSMLGYDSTNKNFHGYLNAADAIISGFASAPTNGHCLQASVASGNVLLSDAGAACGNVTATSLTTNAIPKASGATAVADSSITDDGTTVKTTEPLAALSISTGPTPPPSSVCNSNSPGQAGMYCMSEGTTPTGTLLGVGVVWFDTSHRTHINNHNVDSYPLQTFTTDTTPTHVVFATATPGIYGSRATTAADLPVAQVTRAQPITDIAPVIGHSGLILVLDPPTAIHLTRLFCAVQGTTNVVVNLDSRAEATIGTDSSSHLLGSDLTAVAGGANTSTFSNSPCGGTSSCAVAAHVPVVMTFTSVSGTPTALNCSIDYTVD